MSVSLYVKGFTGFGNEEYLKHYDSLEYCLSKGLTPPKETLEFFDGKLDGCGVLDLQPESALSIAKKGLGVDIGSAITEIAEDEIHIDISMLPENTEKIIVKIDW